MHSQLHTSPLASWHVFVTIIVVSTKKKKPSRIQVLTAEKSFDFACLLQISVAQSLVHNQAVVFFPFFLLDAHQSTNGSNQWQGSTRAPLSQAFVPAA